MKITYIHHSSFSVELDNTILLFDYFKGNLPSFDKNKKLYVFSSHSHHDHFDESIFNLEKIHPNVEYILSNDIKTTKSQNTKFIGANERLLVDNLEIRTLESSDLGVAFIVKVDDKIIYHAGDLNWWHWEGEPEKDNLWQKEIYQQEINSIQQPIDLAFVVVDKRQEESYLLGLQYFLKHVKTRYIMPIHYFGDYTITQMKSLIIPIKLISFLFIIEMKPLRSFRSLFLPI